jgi:hypothetical protein
MSAERARVCTLMHLVEKVVSLGGVEIYDCFMVRTRVENLTT